MTRTVSGTRADGGFGPARMVVARRRRAKPRIFGPGFVIFVMVLLPINIVLPSLPTQPTARADPLQPDLPGPGQERQRQRDLHEGHDRPGQLPHRGALPERTATPATEFVTEIPEFANNNALMALLQSKGVVINASAPSSGTSLLVDVAVHLRAGAADRVALRVDDAPRRAASAAG